jgi:hypothetical protein
LRAMTAGPRADDTQGDASEMVRNTINLGVTDSTLAALHCRSLLISDSGPPLQLPIVE